MNNATSTTRPALETCYSTHTTARAADTAARKVARESRVIGSPLYRVAVRVLAEPETSRTNARWLVLITR